MPILPTSCSRATAASSAISWPREAQARADGDREVVHGVGVLAGVAVAGLERRGERLDDGAHGLRGPPALALEVAQDGDQRVVALREAARGRDRLLAQLQARRVRRRASPAYRPRRGRVQPGILPVDAWNRSGRLRRPARGPCLGHRQRHPRRLRRAEAGGGPAASPASCSTGSSRGNIAMRPRAAWRMPWAAGSSGSDDDQRHAGVGLLAQRHRQRHLAEQRHVELVGELLAAALAEDREALARRRDEARTCSRSRRRSRGRPCAAISAERRATFCAVGCGVVTITNCACGSSWASVIETSPVPGRQVDEQVVELAPVDVLEELRERLVEHRAAPDDGGVLLDEEADRHDLHAAATRAG